MSDSPTLWLCIRRLSSSEMRIVEAPSAVRGGLDLGPVGSGAAIELDEPKLARVALQVRGASNHLLLEGEVADPGRLPTLGVCDRDRNAEAWDDPLRLDFAFEKGRLCVRFDYHWLRIGDHAIRFAWNRSELEPRPANPVEPRARPWWKKVFGGE